MIFGNNKLDMNLIEKIVKKNKVPILTQYEPFKELIKMETNESISRKVKELNDLIKERKAMEKQLLDMQGKKPKLMAKIIYISNELNENKNIKAEQELDKLKQEMEEINNSIDMIFEKLEDRPILIKEKNLELLRETVKHSYEKINKGESNLSEVNAKVAKLRKELDDLRVQKEDIEETVNSTYHFIHAILGHKDMEKLDGKLLK
ncbi:coiled-coil domain-containing protein [Tepidibacter aestuarii]|uniref:coiled-coil domain-containing protein n=1 Tax=Tepidibacter aestuarii TaxID=2925782 RepID=UPI0020C13485|nr:hypothetical protein [Tepidibacter aestuarii]CAH2215001.1 conserved protein of unknown function [Tepidibacter aestuarii]